MIPCTNRYPDNPKIIRLSPIRIFRTSIILPAEAAKLMTTDTENIESETEKNKQEIEESKKRIKNTSQIEKIMKKVRGWNLTTI